MSEISEIAGLATSIPSEDFTTTPADGSADEDEFVGKHDLAGDAQAEAPWNGIEPSHSGDDHVAESPGEGPETDADPESEYPEPRSLSEEAETLDWDEDGPLAEIFRRAGRTLRRCGDLYRGGYASGLVLASRHPSVPPTTVRDPASLASIIADRIKVRRLKDNKLRGTSVPPSLLTTMLGSEAFLQQFPAIDEVVTEPIFLAPDFALCEPGYNNGGPGQRVLYTGEKPWAKSTHERISLFLDVMDFATEADRTNTVAAALTVLLYNHFPGAKPILAVTADKSHAGKDTIIEFASGMHSHVSISYQKPDWPLERAFIGALGHDRGTVLVNVENARLGRESQISSAFLERFTTDPQPLLYTTGMRRPVRRRNNIVVALSTNFGSLSEDLLNRSLPIHLAPVGDVASRRSPIGNPKLEYLPTHRREIAAELRGMVERWKAEGCPPDLTVRHPFTAWARAVGGMLRVNGFEHFLANYGSRRTSQDQLRQAIGELAASVFKDAEFLERGQEGWVTASDWADAATKLGLIPALVPGPNRQTERGKQRAIGVVFSAHRGETFAVETEDERLVFQLEKARRRFDGDQPSTRYRFITRKNVPIEADEPAI